MAGKPEWLIGEPGPQAVKLVLVIARVWQVSQAAVPIGICVVGADEVPFASVPLWQDAQPVAGKPEWLITPGFQLVKPGIAAAWQSSQGWLVVMWPAK